MVLYHQTVASGLIILMKIELQVVWLTITYFALGFLILVNNMCDKDSLVTNQWFWSYINQISYLFTS